MDRQVGKRKRRSRARGPAPSGAARPRLEELEEGQRPAYPRAPNNPTLERELAGSLAAWWHNGPDPDPADFYDPTLGTIARAFVEHRARIRFLATIPLELHGTTTLVLTYTGLEEVLAELGDPNARRTAFYAGIIASEAPATHAGDVGRLHRLALARARLMELEDERAELERIDPRA